MLALAVAALATSMATSRAMSQPRPPEPLGEIAARLGSPDRAVRLAAYEALGALPESAVPAIRERLSELVTSRPTPEDAQQLLHQIRHATGSRRADDLVDVADGIPVFLDTRRDRDALRIAEPLLLMRSLERIATTDALVTIPEVLRLDPDAWTMEGRRSTLRLGDRAAAAIVRARGHEHSAGREWARWSGRELSLDDAGRLVQRLGPRDLADVLSAWGATRTMDAMPVVASFVDDRRRFIRDAAREALGAYGQNGVWQAREQFRLRLGEDADTSWGWERTLRELCARLDDQRLALVRDLQTAAEVALDRGDPDSATRSLEALLARAPDAGSPEIATLFARAGDAWTTSGGRANARAAYERAIRLAPSDASRGAWEARLSFVEAEDALERGVLDVEAYRRAARGDPSCERCARMLATIEAQAAPAIDPSAAERRQTALALAAALFAVLGAALLMTKRRDDASSVDDARDPSDEEDPDLADITLPG